MVPSRANAMRDPPSRVVHSPIRVEREIEEPGIRTA